MHITFPGGSIWLCVREKENICLYACDPLSDLEKRLDQSEEFVAVGQHAAQYK